MLIPIHDRTARRARTESVLLDVLDRLRDAEPSARRA
jgi:hypothetical protein